MLAAASPRGLGDSLQNRLLAPIVLSGLIGWVLRRPRAGRAFARTLFGERADRQQVEFARRLMAMTPARTQGEAPRALLDSGAGHFPVLERAERFAQDVNAFVAALS